MSEPSAIVCCYSGHTYAQEPQSFVWQGQERTVAGVESVRRVLDRESGETSVQFVVETREHTHFRLCYNEDSDRWVIGLMG